MPSFIRSYTPKRLGFTVRVTKPVSLSGYVNRLSRRETLPSNDTGFLTVAQ